MFTLHSSFALFALHCQHTPVDNELLLQIQQLLINKSSMTPILDIVVVAAAEFESFYISHTKKNAPPLLPSSFRSYSFIRSTSESSRWHTQCVNCEYETIWWCSDRRQQQQLRPTQLNSVRVYRFSLFTPPDNVQAYHSYLEQQQQQRDGDKRGREWVWAGEAEMLLRRIIKMF